MLLLLEYQAKIIRGRKPTKLGNLPNAFVGIHQHFFCFCQAHVQQKIDRGTVGVFLKIIDKGCFGYEKSFRQIVQALLFRVMRVEMVDDFQKQRGDTALGGGGRL